MCGSIPAPLSAQPTMPSGVGAAGGGATTATAATTPATTTPATTTGGGAPDKTDGGGAPGKLPTTGGGAADGAANLQLQQTLTALVQALTALTELLKTKAATAVNGASGGGPGQKPDQVPPGKDDPTQGGGGCDKGIPLPPFAGGGSTAATAAHPADGHPH